MQKNSKFYKFINAVWEYLKIAWLELTVLAGAVVLDLSSKAIVDATMDLDDSVTLIPHFLHITYTHNPAAAFGSNFGLDKLLGQTGVMVLFIVISFLAVGLFGYFMYRNRGKSKVCRIAFALIIGGAIGNLIDRLCFQYVRDFIQFEYFGLTIFGYRYFAIFNFADAALCIGVAMFAVYYIFIYKEPKKETETKSDPDDEIADEILDEIADEQNKQADETIENANTVENVENPSDTEKVDSNEEKNENDG